MLASANYNNELCRQCNASAVTNLATLSQQVKGNGLVIGLRGVSIEKADNGPNRERGGKANFSTHQLSEDKQRKNENVLVQSTFHRSQITGVERERLESNFFTRTGNTPPCQCYPPPIHSP